MHDKMYKIAEKIALVAAVALAMTLVAGMLLLVCVVIDALLMTPDYDTLVRVSPLQSLIDTLLTVTGVFGTVLLVAMAILTIIITIDVVRFYLKGRAHAKIED